MRNLNILRPMRNVALLIGLLLIVGGIAWHDVPVAVTVAGVILAYGAVSGMILARRGK